MLGRKWFVAVALGLGLVGCGGTESPFLVQIPIFINSSGNLDPNFVSAPVGAKVIVVNHDNEGHTVSFGSPVGGSTFLNPNESTSVFMPDTGASVSVSVSNGSGGSISVF